jgi:hypothetical protein
MPKTPWCPAVRHLERSCCMSGLQEHGFPLNLWRSTYVSIFLTWNLVWQRTYLQGYQISSLPSLGHSTHLLVTPFFAPHPTCPDSSSRGCHPHPNVGQASYHWTAQYNYLRKYCLRIDTSTAPAQLVFFRQSEWQQLRVFPTLLCSSKK